MIDDDLNMTALPETRNIKSIVTAEDRLCVERKGKQATQGLLYARLLCFGNGNLVAAHDTSDGFWRRQILISVKDRAPDRVDDPFLIDKLAAELPGIFLWALEGLKRLLSNQYRFTLSERARQNLAAAMEDGCHLDQFMQANSYVRFDPEKSARSTYLFRAYNKWCADNLETPFTQKKFSQYLFKNAERYGIRFSMRIEGGFRGNRGAYFCIPRRKNWEGRLWRKAELSSLIPHLGLCKPIPPWTRRWTGTGGAFEKISNQRFFPLQTLAEST